MTTGELLVLGGFGYAAGVAFGARCPRLWLAATLAGALGTLAAALQVLGGAPEWEWRSTFALGGEPLHLRLDALGALFLVLVGAVGGAGAVYSREYWSDQGNPDSAPRGRVGWSAMVLSMGLVLVASDGVHFLIAWELFAISSFFLVTLDGQRREARAAGWLYLAASHAGTLCLFAFFATLAARTGSWDLGPMRDHANLTPMFWLALAGFGVKAGLFPMHLWLPSAHAGSPSHVSALMSGVAIKMGIYGLVRFTGWLPAPAAAGWVLMGLGSIGALLGIAFAFAQDDLKRLLAYSSVENIGIISLGLGAALLGATHGRAAWCWLALGGALLHVWNHGLFKSLLFLGAGSVLHETGAREMSRLGGLWRSMPWTAGFFALGAAAVCGLPPLNGFVSEWLVTLGLLDAAAARGPSSWAAAPGTIALAAAGALALACFSKACAMVFFGAPRTAAAERAQEPGWWMRAPMLALACGCAAVGLAPVWFWPAVARAVDAWNPAAAAVAAPAPVSILGGVNLALAALFVLGAFSLLSFVRARGMKRAPTWDCGYAFPTARMQVTAGSFSGIAAGWFAWIFQTERALRRPRGPFPARAIRRDRVRETILECIVEPAGRVVMRSAAAVRRLQHGRVQFYIVYVAGGLAVLAIIVLFGRTR